MVKPKIRFKGFEGEWKSIDFCESFKLLKNNTLSRAELTDEGEIANIHYGDILIKYAECIDTAVDKLTYIIDNEVGKNLLNDGALKKGDIIFADTAEDNTVGKCSELICNDNEVIVAGLHTIACRPQIDIAERYLGYYLNSPAYHNQLLPHIQGTKVSSISRKAINTTKVVIPKEKEEEQILASYFASLDFQISASISHLASLKQIKAASLQAMFPQEGETMPKIRFKGFEGEWESLDLCESFELLKNNTLSRAELTDEGKIANIHYGDILIKYGECIDTAVDKLTYIIDNEVGKNLLNDGALKKGDIIFADTAEDNTVGKCSELICNDNEVIVAGLHTIACRPQIDIAERYLGYYLNSPAYHNQLLPHIQGTKVSSISRKAINTTKVVIPKEKEEQQAIASYFTSLDHQISLHAKRLEKLKQIKAACLEKMFV